MNGDPKEFANRPWMEIEHSKRDHWVREFARRGHVATFHAAQALWMRMRAVRPDWPTDEQRAADFAAHVRLKELLDRARDAFPGR
jgi:hypothetical protein